MAVLSDKTTTKELSFDKYVKNNPNFLGTIYEIERGKTADFYVKKGSKISITKNLKAGTKLNIIESDIVQIGGLQCAKVKISSTIGFVAINKIRKPTVGNGTSYETEVVDALNSIFGKLKRPINIKIGTKTYTGLAYAIQVDAAIKRNAGVKADPKADIIICRDKNNPLGAGSIYISHKKAGGPEAFQQYGGITEVSGTNIYNHPEVQKFLQQTTEHIINGKLKNALMKKVKDDVLINMSIFGPDYTEQNKVFGLQHVQLIGQGKVKLDAVNASKDLYKLHFDHQMLSGDLSTFSGGYSAVFGATYRAGRGFKYDNKQYGGARVGIYPQKLIASRTGLITL